MTAQPNIVNTNPVLESVTLQLTPREAYLLMWLLGNLSGNQVLEALNRSNYISGEYCLVNGPDSLRQRATVEEAQALTTHYHTLGAMFVDCKKKGVQ